MSSYRTPRPTTLSQSGYRVVGLAAAAGNDLISSDAMVADVTTLRDSTDVLTAGVTLSSTEGQPHDLHGSCQGGDFGIFDLLFQRRHLLRHTGMSFQAQSEQFIHKLVHPG